MNNIVAFKGIINRGNSEELKLSFPDALSLIRPSFTSLCNRDAKLNPYWISGFIEGDGSFIIRLKANPSKWISLSPGEGEGLSVSAVISIGLDIREETLLYKIKIFFKFLNCFKLYKQ